MSITNVSMFGVRLVKERSGRFEVEKTIKTPQDVLKYAIDVFEMDTRAEEVMMMLTLDTKNHVNGSFEVSVGSLNSSIVHPREIFKRALLANASGIILMHNHPSGDPEPSSEDIATTKRIVDAGAMIGIKLLDHLVIGDKTNYVSFKERGLI